MTQQTRQKRRYALNDMPAAAAADWRSDGLASPAGGDSAQRSCKFWPEAAQSLWQQELPEGFERLAVPPSRFECHQDQDAHAVKWIGLDAQGRRCWLRHVHVQTEERFDIDEYLVEVPLRRLWQSAWRLVDDRWLSLREGSEHLESCRPAYWSEGPSVQEQVPAGW